MKAFRVKNLLNKLPTYYHFHSIMSKIFLANICFACNASDSATHWLICHNPQMISQIVHLSISKIVTKHLSDQTLTQQRATINLIESHTSFNNILSSNPQTHALPTTLKGLISSHLLQALQAVGIQHKEAADIIIQILLHISTETHEQI